MNTDTTLFRVESRGQEFIQIALSPDCQGTFTEQLDSLQQKYNLICESLKVNSDNLLFAKVFLSDYINQQSDVESHPFFIDSLSNCALSIIEEPPMNGFRINVLLLFVKGMSINKFMKDNVFHAHIGERHHIFQSIRNVNQDACLEENTRLLFEQHDEVLSEYGMSIAKNCIRTWLYVRDVDNEYMDVVRGRNNFFSNVGLTKDTHFITSTGIEGCIWNSKSSVNIDFYSIGGVDTDKIKYLKALDYLNPTHEYGVSFERGVGYSLGDWRFILLSGTASIDKQGQVVYVGDVITQLERVFLNIEQLLKDGNATIADISHLIIYIRDISDYAVVENYIHQNHSAIPYVIVYGKVCRPGWLIEIECMAITAKIC